MTDGLFGVGPNQRDFPCKTFSVESDESNKSLKSVVRVFKLIRFIRLLRLFKPLIIFIRNRLVGRVNKNLLMG